MDATAHAPPPRPPIDHIDISNFKIQPSETANNIIMTLINIGATFDRHMSLDQHVTNIC